MAATTMSIGTMAKSSCPTQINTGLLRHHNNCKGFTLLEILVVLVMVSLLGGLLMQGFSQVLQLRVRLVGELVQQQAGRLQEHWFREMVAGLTPAAANDQNDTFKGEAHRLHGLTMSSLQGSPGSAAPVTMELVIAADKTELRYRAGKETDWLLASWLQGEAQFYYLDSENKWHDNWPPALKNAQQLPAAIQLKVATLPDPVHWLVTLPGRKEPKINVLDTLDTF